MYILINNKPVDVFKIIISSIKTFTMYEYIPEHLLPDFDIKALDDFKKTHEFGDNGYYFIVKTQKENIYSKIYDTKDQAQTSLEHLLMKVNDIRSSVIRVEI